VTCGKIENQGLGLKVLEKALVLSKTRLRATSPAKKNNPRWRISRLLRKCNSGGITGIYGTLIS
jgi:hypothetical protein